MNYRQFEQTPDGLWRLGGEGVGFELDKPAAADVDEMNLVLLGDLHLSVNSRLATTQIYTHVNIQQLMEVYAATHPRS